MKIIYIITFPPKYEYKDGPEPEFFWINNKNEEICVWRMDRGHVFARDVKKYFPEIDFEVWRPDYRAEKEYAHIFEDGVTHRSFPARTVQFRRGLKQDKFWTSVELLEKLEQYVDQDSEDQDLILHLPVDFSYLSYTIIRKFVGKIPFLHTSHLNPSLLNPSLSTYNPIKYLHRLLMKITYNKYLKFLTEIAVPADRVNFFKKNTSANIHLLNSLNFDFEWAKNKISRAEARKKLSLPPETFILFSSSRLVSEKQIDKMLLSLSELKGLDFKCIISGVGDIKYEKYLKELVKKLSLDSKISFVGFLTDDLIDHYCAADVFITTSGSESGPVSAIKAFALGIPVISTDTGIAANLLKENDAGVILDKKNNAHWAKKIRSVINNMEISRIDPEMLINEYDLKNSIIQLVDSYKRSIKNIRIKQTKYLERGK